jgi:hypothetical protein
MVTTFAFERIYFWESTVWQITTFRKESCMFNISGIIRLNCNRHDRIFPQSPASEFGPKIGMLRKFTISSGLLVSPSRLNPAIEMFPPKRTPR